MANQKHVHLLKQGSNVWNRWRIQHLRTKIDLSGADLTEADLKEADLTKADLSGANLSGADLRRTHLGEANLTKADFTAADFTAADLSETDLREANLTKTNFTAAYLTRADLREANLREDDLSGANLRKANLSGANLTKASLIEATLREANLREANLREADLYEAVLYEAVLYKAVLTRADLRETNLSGVDFREAKLREADLSGANLTRANLSGADLTKADLSGANLSRANISGANLSGADLNRATMIGTNLTRATLNQCTIYGISAWDVQLDEAKQENLVITHYGEPAIAVDNLEVAQFIYLLLNNPKIRDVIDTVAKTAVLILGRFTLERKAILDAIKEALRTNGYLPILFDFEKPHSRNFTETVSTLAHLSRFIIADLTDPSSVPHELATIVPTLVIPFIPLFHQIDRASREYAMFRDLSIGRTWVLPIHHYTTPEDLLATLQTHIIQPAEMKAQELIALKNSSGIEQMRREPM